MESLSTDQHKGAPHVLNTARLSEDRKLRHMALPIGFHFRGLRRKCWSSFPLSHESRLVTLHELTSLAGNAVPHVLFLYEHVAEPKIGTLQKRNNQFIPGISRVFSCSVSVRFKSEYHSPSDFLSVFCRKCSLFSKIPIKGSVGCLKIDSIPSHG